MLPSGPAEMPHGSAFGVGTSYSFTTPVEVMLAIRSVPNSVNHIVPSVAAAM